MAFVLLVVAWLVWALARPALFKRRVARALKQLAKHRQKLEHDFVTAAAATGKPRGLSWKECGFQPGVILARDRANGDFVGLVGVTISFEAIEGGGMEDVEAVGNLRAATAVFNWNGREWSTQGRAVFNLEPREVLERYRDSLDPISGQISAAAVGVRDDANS
ncbi:MAG TPA: hypothetical protein VHK01_21070 [Lacipirellulaceae bacterium]|nr:hypothetical protein [Lacipirellulaceae bacterium]